MDGISSNPPPPYKTWVYILASFLVLGASMTVPTS